MADRIETISISIVQYKGGNPDVGIRTLGDYRWAIDLHYFSIIVSLWYKVFKKRNK